MGYLKKPADGAVKAPSYQLQRQCRLLAGLPPEAQWAQARLQCGVLFPQPWFTFLPGSLTTLAF